MGLSLICGWPGAMIAQQTLRHKSAKEDFHFVWLFTASGSAFLQSLLG
jgi:uncharacterized membrane protein YsdA (DUF1294 family)